MWVLNKKTHTLKVMLAHTTGEVDFLKEALDNPDKYSREDLKIIIDRLHKDVNMRYEKMKEIK